jgi:hypothetical protein
MTNTSLLNADEEIKEDIAAHYREIARDLRYAANAMDRMANLEPGSKVNFTLSAYSYSKEAKPLAAAFCRAFRGVDKKQGYSDGDLRLVCEYSPAFEAALTIKREAVCRKVTKLQEVTVWECDSILDANPTISASKMSAYPEVERG